MKKVMFYLIESTENSTDLSEDSLLPHEKLACEKALEAWQNRIRVLIACHDKQQAEKIDEYLWQLDTEHFVPHNLAGEGPRGGAPVEICWPGCRANGARQLLINLQETFAEFSPMFNDIIDFVPAEERLKTLARERYQAYRNVGFNLKTIPVAMK